MSWTCPDCNRTFRNANQQHTCILVTKESLFQTIKKYLQTSRRRVAHAVPVDSAEDIDAQLLGWIGASYILIADA